MKLFNFFRRLRDSFLLAPQRPESTEPTSTLAPQAGDDLPPMLRSKLKTLVFFVWEYCAVQDCADNEVHRLHLKITCQELLTLWSQAFPGNSATADDLHSFMVEEAGKEQQKLVSLAAGLGACEANDWEVAGFHCACAERLTKNTLSWLYQRDADPEGAGDTAFALPA